MIDMLNSPDLGFRLRVRVGDLLSGLGDPRLASLETAPARWVDSLIAIPAATEIVIGRDKPHAVKRDKYTRVPAAPPLRMDFEAFRIGMYPVTNLDYELFIRSRGYESLSLVNQRSQDVGCTRRRVRARPFPDD